MKQVMLSIMTIMVATGILVGMFLYTISVLREYERKVLLGIPSVIVQEE